MSDTINVDIDLLEVDEDAPDFIVQGTVIIFQGARYIVQKRNPVNYKIEDENGNKYNLRNTAPMKRAKNQHWNGNRVDDYSRIMREIDSGTFFQNGTIVQFKTAAERAKFPGVWVVVNKGDVNYKLYQLGGSDRFVRTHPSYIERAYGEWVPSTDGHVGQD